MRRLLNWIKNLFKRKPKVKPRTIPLVAAKTKPKELRHSKKPTLDQFMYYEGFGCKEVYKQKERRHARTHKTKSKH